MRFDEHLPRDRRACPVAERCVQRSVDRATKRFCRGERCAANRTARGAFGIPGEEHAVGERLERCSLRKMLLRGGCKQRRQGARVAWLNLPGNELWIGFRGGGAVHGSLFVSRANRVLLRVNESPSALVISVGRNSAWVALDGEPGIRLAQIRRSSGARSMPVPGDRVRVSPLDDAIVVIDAIEPRDRLLARRTVAGREKALAANVELLVTVTSLAAPPPRTIVLDQLLVYAHFEEIAALVVFTKADLTEGASPLPALYNSLGYRCLSLDAKHGLGVEDLRAAIGGSRALLVGVSGVGKSSIFRWMGGENEIGDLSRFGLGRQTTTAARLVRLDPGFLIDSPGVADFGLGLVTPGELAPAFPEFAAAGRCKFADCAHRSEPGCAIRNAVTRGEIAASRYDSYTRFLSER